MNLNRVEFCPECGSVLTIVRRNFEVVKVCKCGYITGVARDAVPNKPITSQHVSTDSSRKKKNCHIPSFTPSIRSQMNNRTPRLAIPLWPHQIEAIHRWENCQRKGIVEMATATGKTVVGMRAIERCCEDLFKDGEREARILVTCNSLMILDQWRSEIIAKLGNGLDIGDHDQHISMCSQFGFRVTIHFPSLQKLAIDYKAGDPTWYSRHFNLIIVDEVHHLAAPDFRNAMQVPHDAIIGLSATVEGRQRIEVLAEHLGRVVYHYGIRDAVRDGIIPPFEIVEMKSHLTDSELDHFTRITHDINQKLLRVRVETRGFVFKIRKHDPLAPDLISLGDFIELMSNANYHGMMGDVPESWLQLQRMVLNRRRILQNATIKNQQAVELAVKMGVAKKCLLFHMIIETCDSFHVHVKHKHVPAWLLHSKLDQGERELNLMRFKHADMGVLIAPKVLDEGVDIPDAEVGINAASYTTKLQLVQRMGRILRKYEGKKPVFYQLFCTVDTATKKVIDEVKQALNFEIETFRKNVEEFGTIVTKHEIPLLNVQKSTIRVIPRDPGKAQVYVSKNKTPMTKKAVKAARQVARGKQQAMDKLGSSYTRCTAIGTSKGKEYQCIRVKGHPGNHTAHREPGMPNPRSFRW